MRKQLKGAAILEPIFKRQPRHPGVAHYLIHLYDTPALAEKGLEAARRYAEIAPAAPHAQHMPSHIFTRVGYWKESIASNTERRGPRRPATKPTTSCTRWTTWSMPICSSGRTRRRQAVVDEMRGIGGFTETFIAGPYALAVSPARYAVERGDWKAPRSLRSGRARSPMSRR